MCSTTLLNLEFFYNLTNWPVWRRHGIQHNDIEHNDFLHYYIQHYDTQHNDTQHDDSEHNGIQLNAIQHDDALHNATQHNDTQLHDTQYNDTQHDDTQHDDTQHDDTHHNDIQHNAIQHNDIQYNDIQYNGTQHSEIIIMTLSIKGLFTTFSKNDTQHNNTTIMLGVFMLSVAFAECRGICFAWSTRTKISKEKVFQHRAKCFKTLTLLSAIYECL